MCIISWCNNKPDKSGKGYCRKHYDEIRKYGTTTNFRPNGNRNEYINKGEYTELHILDEEGNTKVVVKVDNEDVDNLKKYSFRYEKDRYIKTVSHNKTKYIHRLVLNYNGDLEIDHINRDKLDNRKSNLRIVDHKTNAMNKERNNNTCILKLERLKSKPFCLKIAGKHIGYYKTLEEAKRVRDNIISTYAPVS